MPDRSDEEAVVVVGCCGVGVGAVGAADVFCRRRELDSGLDMHRVATCRVQVSVGLIDSLASDRQTTCIV